MRQSLVAALPGWPQPLVASPRRLISPGPAIRLGQYAEVAGAAVSAARTGQGVASGSYGFGSTGQALSTTGALIGTTGALASAGIALMATAPIPVVGWIAAAVGALLTIAGMFMGGTPQLSHAQREALEVQRVAGTVGSMIGQIQSARSLDELWAILKAWQSGYVGGTSSVAVPIYFRPPGGDEGDPAAEAAATAAWAWIDAQPDMVVPPVGYTDWHDFVTRTGQGPGMGPTAQIGLLGAPWPGTPGLSPNYPVWTKHGFFAVLERYPDYLRAHTQAGVTPSMLAPIDTNVRNAILNAMQTLGYRFTPGGGAAQLFAAAAAAAPTSPDSAQLSAWVGQAYSQLLGRAASSAELASTVAALMAQQITPSQFLTSLTTSAEFVAAHGTTATITPSGQIIVGGAATTTGQPLSTYWWQNAAPASSDQPVQAAAMLPSSPLGLLALGALGLVGLLLVAGRPRSTRRR